jgi:uncharacterized spore protein YtfJ
MNLPFDELIRQITEFIRNEAKTETVVGEPFKLGAFECVPVIKVGMGFGSGGGEGAETRDKKGQGMGAGAGMGIEPIGFLVSRGEEIEFLEAGKAHGLSAAVEKLPSMIERIYENRNREEVEPA